MNELTILVCENYYMEYQEAIKRKGFNDVTIKSFPCLCDYSQKKKTIKETLDNEELDFENTVLICNKTCEINKQINESSGIYKTYYLTNCLAQLIPPQLLEYIALSGGYVLTTGWLNDWKERMHNGGFDRATAQKFYQEFCKEFVFFDSKIDSKAEHKIKELSEYFNIPYNILPLELECVQYFLKSIVYEWRINKKSKQCKQDMDELVRQNSDYAALLDIMHKMSLAQTERETIEKLKQLFLVLFGAQICKFWGSNEEKPEDIEAFIKSGDDYLYCEEDTKFYLKVSYNNQIFGVFEAGEFLFSEHIDRYLNLSIAIIKVSALVISNTRRYEMIIEAKKEIEYTSIHDSLTGLYNRTYYNSLNGKDFVYDNIAVFMCDVDNLKYANDNYGHSEGDKIIQFAAKVLKQCFRENDIIARIGGDEFVVIALDCNSEQAKQISKRIEKTIKNQNQNNNSKLSLSVGYSVTESKVFIIDDMVKEADNLMYENKRKNKQNLKL